MSTDQIRMSNALKRLFTAYQTMRNGKDAVTSALLYSEIVAPFPVEDLEIAVGQFVEGVVPDQSLKFAPTPAELATVCRQLRDSRLQRIAEYRAAQRQIERREQPKEWDTETRRDLAKRHLSRLNF